MSEMMGLIKTENFSGNWGFLQTLKENMKIEKQNSLT